MVAESQSQHNQQPKRPRLRPRNHRRARPGSLPVSLHSEAYSLYVVEGKSPREIEQITERRIKARQVSCLARDEHWVADRTAQREQMEAESRNEAVARARERAERLQSAIAIKAESLAMRSLDLCEEKLTDKDAKGLSMASTAARNMVDITRRTRGLDRQQGDGSQAGMTLNVFMARGQTIERTERNVTPSAQPTAIAIDAKPIT